MKLFGFTSDLVKVSTDNYYSATIISDYIAVKTKKYQYRGLKGYFSVNLKAKHKSRVILSAVKVKQSKQHQPRRYVDG